MNAKRKDKAMTRKDYELVAGVLKNLGDQTQNWQAVTLAATHLARAFEAQNDRFDAERFFNACGLVWTNEP
jgi:hypothetical protein